MRNYLVSIAFITACSLDPATGQNLSVTFEKGSSGIDPQHSHVAGVSGLALDLSSAAKFRQPLTIDKPGVNLDRFTALIWAKTVPGTMDREALLCVTEDGNDDRGLIVGASDCGSWFGRLDDGRKTFLYEPTLKRQPLNDGNWHLLGLSYDKTGANVSFYYDGVKVATYNTAELRPLELSRLYIGGKGKTETASFNGFIDNFLLYDHIFTADEMFASYLTYIKGVKAPKAQGAVDSVRFMTFDTDDAGGNTGRKIGVERVADVISSSGADIAGLIGAGSSGAVIADRLGFYLYHHSSNLSIVSRFPFTATHNFGDPQSCAAVTVEAGRGQKFNYINLSLREPWSEDTSTITALPGDVIREEERNRRAEELRQILYDARDMIGDDLPLVVSGGFNSGSHQEWTEEFRDMHAGLVIDWPATALMKETGFMDSFRELYPSVRDNPGISSFAAAGSYRKDFVYYTGGLRPLRSVVIDKHPVRFPSSNAALMTTFRIIK